VFGLLLEALIRYWHAGRLAVKEIACCCVARWRPALMVFLPVGVDGLPSLLLFVGLAAVVC